MPGSPNLLRRNPSAASTNGGRSRSRSASRGTFSVWHGRPVRRLESGEQAVPMGDSGVWMRCQRQQLPVLARKAGRVEDRGYLELDRNSVARSRLASRHSRNWYNDSERDTPNTFTRTSLKKTRRTASISHAVFTCSCRINSP